MNSIGRDGTSVIVLDACQNVLFWNCEDCTAKRVANWFSVEFCWVVQVENLVQ